MDNVKRGYSMEKRAESPLMHAEAVALVPTIVDDELADKRLRLAERMAESHAAFWRWVETRK